MIERGKAERMRADMQQQLIAKIDSPEALSQYLREGGSDLLFGSDAAETVLARQRVLQGLQAAVLFAAIAAGFLILYQVATQGQETMLALGVLALSLAVGCGASAGVAYRLAKSWGTMRDQSGRGSNRPV